LRACNDPVLEAFAEREELGKLEKTYFSKLRTGEVHATISVLGAATGRTSSSNINLQNQPRGAGVRECFVPRPGFVFISCDFDSQELRAFAQVCETLLGYSSLADAYRRDPDYDPHIAFACRLEKIEYEDGLSLLRAGDKHVKQRRNLGKACNFGFIGGLGTESFLTYAKNYGVDIDIEQAKRLKKEWFDSIPEAREYFDHINHLVGAGEDGCGVVTHLFSGRVRGGAYYCPAANSYFQGLGSDASKMALWLVALACYREKGPLNGSHPLMLVHDELILESPEETAHEAALELQRLMIKGMGVFCPDVPARATACLSRVWSKDAEPTYREGRLVPWDGGGR
jgi:DNA polymerase I-like protein with 3'-5' exonuclease and polymerase domains